MTLQKTSGFTLVELAIVMTIIGLLIGGILKGQELLENARVTSTIAQVKSYDSAVTGFRDIYDAIPGDMSNANTRVPGCTANCNAPAAAGTVVPNDGRLGAPAWSTGWAAQAGEPLLFWLALLKANLISGVTDDLMTTPATTAAWNVTNPSAKIGGGFVSGFGSGGTPAGMAVATTGGPTGMLIGLASSPTAALNAANATVLAPSRAAQIDRKMDDGMPDSGSIYAFGTAGTSATTGCINGTAPAQVYSEANSAKECGLIIKIQG